MFCWSIKGTINPTSHISYGPYRNTNFYNIIKQSRYYYLYYFVLPFYHKTTTHHSFSLLQKPFPILFITVIYTLALFTTFITESVINGIQRIYGITVHKNAICWYFLHCNILFLGLKMQVIPSYHDVVSWHLAITSPIISICLYCLILSQTVGGSTCFKLPILLSLSQYSVLKYLQSQVSIIRMDVLFSFLVQNK